LDPKQEQKMLKEVREFLLQLALELEASAAAARKAAELVYDRGEKARQQTWPQVQQMYTRLSQANLLLQNLKTTIDDALKQEENGQSQPTKK